MHYFKVNSEEENTCFPKLSFKERVIGFVVCTILGYAISIISLGSFLGVATGKPEKFAIMYSLGNVIALMGTGFLVGPSR